MARPNIMRQGSCKTLSFLCFSISSIHCLLYFAVSIIRILILPTKATPLPPLPLRRWSLFTSKSCDKHTSIHPLNHHDSRRVYQSGCHSTPQSSTLPSSLVPTRAMIMSSLDIDDDVDGKPEKGLLQLILLAESQGYKKAVQVRETPHTHMMITYIC